MDNARYDKQRLIEAAKCLALMPGSLADRVAYAHKWYVSQINVISRENSNKKELKALRAYTDRMANAGGLDEWLANEGNDTVQDYAIAIWDAYYAAVLKPAGY